MLDKRRQGAISVLLLFLFLAPPTPLRPNLSHVPLAHGTARRFSGFQTYS